MDMYSKVHGKEEIYFDEDKRLKAIEELEDPKEIEAALEILDEKIDESLKEGDTSPSESETEKPDKKETPDEKKGEGEDTSGKQKEGDKKPSGDQDDAHKKVADKLEGKEPGGDEKFLLTEEVINKQPEKDREILNNYKDKSREELAKAAANAVTVKSPYLKDNEKAINLLTEQFLEKSDEELVSTLVDSQREVGKKAEPPASPQLKFEEELPDISDSDPELTSILEKETLKRLKKSYPNMPEVASMESEEYKEWRRDLNVDNPDNKFKEDLEETKVSVRTELSKVIYIQNNLRNLFDETPAEILPLFTEGNLPRLKALNDDPMGVLLQDINSEVLLIKKNLEKYGLTEKDLGIDFTITKDESGQPYNETLNNIISEGKTSDGKPIPSPKIIGQRGKVFWLKTGELVRKFKDEYDDKILTAFVNKKAQEDKKVKEKLKEETLIAGGGKTGGGSKKAITLEAIEKETNPAVLDKIIAELEKV